MKVKVCDVCYYDRSASNDKRYTKSSWRLSIKKQFPEERLAIDACHKHKDFFKGLKFVQAKEKINKMYDGHLQESV